MSQGYLTHVIQVGDSLQRIAVAYGLSNWSDLVYMNELEYPFIHDILNSGDYENNPKVLSVGDIILVPSNYNVPPPALRAQDSRNLEKLAYGSDLSIYEYDSEWLNVTNLEEKGELTENGEGDLKLAEGVGNLAQRLNIRFNVSLGSMFLHPKFGSKLKNMAGLKGTEQNLIKMRLEAQRTILTDQMVKSVSNIIIYKTQGGVIIEADIVPQPPYKPFKYTGTVISDQNN